MLLFGALATLLSAQVPFVIEASQDVSREFPGAPKIQSFSFAQWNGRWVFIGGRIAGYHSVGGGSAEFLRKDANREVWVVDTCAAPARTYHQPLSQLPDALQAVKDQWSASGQLYYQDGPTLYVAGGYGQTSAGKWVTFPVLSRVDLPALIEGVMHGDLPAQAVRYVSTPLAQSAGGEMLKLADGLLYLVMGHVFTGSYTAFEGNAESNSERASQQYLEELRALKVSEDVRGEMAVSLVKRYSDASEFHRRDLTVTPILSAEGLGLAAYGGVFAPRTQLSYSRPIYLFPGGSPQADDQFEQKMNVYECARLAIYDRRAQAMYTTFFGGISRFSWDAVARQFVENTRTGNKTEPVYLDGMQWSDQISTIRKTFGPKGSTMEMVHPAPLPGYIGTNAVFIAAPGALRAASGTDILDFDGLRGKRTMVGYIYGGIQASPYQFPYRKTAAPYNSGSVPTKPSDLVVKVYVTAE